MAGTNDARVKVEVSRGHTGRIAAKYARGLEKVGESKVRRSFLKIK